MANYIETFKSKMDWGNVFVRTGDFPLDRSSIFSSYADAVLYAKGDGSDSRGLGKTSYIGQILSVYESGEVKVYVKYKYSKEDIARIDADINHIIENDKNSDFDKYISIMKNEINRSTNLIGDFMLHKKIDVIREIMERTR